MTTQQSGLNLNTKAPIGTHKMALYNRVQHLADELRSGKNFLDLHYPVDSEVLASEIASMKFETRELTRGLVEILNNIHQAANTSSVNAEAGYYQVMSSIVQTMFFSGYFVMEENDQFGYLSADRTTYENFVRCWYVDFMRLAREHSKNGDGGLFEFRLQLIQDAGESAMVLRERLQEIYAESVMALKNRR